MKIVKISTPKRQMQIICQNKNIQLLRLPISEMDCSNSTKRIFVLFLMLMKSQFRSYIYCLFSFLFFVFFCSFIGKEDAKIIQNPITCKDAVIFKLVGSPWKGRREFREQILSLVLPLAHTDDHAHGVIERQFSKILPRKIVIVYEIPKNESGKIIKNNRQIQK